MLLDVAHGAGAEPEGAGNASGWSSGPVGLGNSVVAGQAAFLYSLMRQLHRVVRSGEMVASGADSAAPVGGRWPSERCGRCWL